MVARRPSRLVQRFRAAARRSQAASVFGQAARRAAARRVKPARSLREGRWADADFSMARHIYCMRAPDDEGRPDDLTDEA